MKPTSKFIIKDGGRKYLALLKSCCNKQEPFRFVIPGSGKMHLDLLMSINFRRRSDRLRQKKRVIYTK